MKYDNFFRDDKYKILNDNVKMLINNLIRIFDEKCTKEFYPAWRGNEGNTKVFAIKSQVKLMSKYGKSRENIITIRLRMDHLDIEVFKGIYCNGSEFFFSSDVTDNDLAKLYKDINDLFASKIINE